MTDKKTAQDTRKISSLKISDIYDKNLNFLIGSGASFGLFPTLQLSVKGEDGSLQTIETLATRFEGIQDIPKKAALFMHYYKECIAPAMKFAPMTDAAEGAKKAVLDNYESFLKTILSVLMKKKNNDRKFCNLYTTNYDGCIAHAADRIIRSGTEEFILNDGARGFFRRHFSAKNYNSFVEQSGVFDKYSTQISQINLLQVHGSVYWKKDQDNIEVDYNGKSKMLDELIPDITDFSNVLKSADKTTRDIAEIPIPLSQNQIDAFWDAYNNLPIVNPTKWKFHETVFEEHYYQMLRHLSYELEKPATVLITFGFSFADEHILSLIKRALGNPSLQIFVSCFNEAEFVNLSNKFSRFKNIMFLSCGSDDLNFARFNSDFFTLKEST